MLAMQLSAGGVHASLERVQNEFVRYRTARNRSQTVCQKNIKTDVKMSGKATRLEVLVKHTIEACHSTY